MKATGIVVEYNPFHNGHKLHLNKARELTQADVVIAVMSGSFVQRGEPAILPKWERTRMALAAGVDMVVELPVSFATQHATIFAEEAVRILDAIHVDTLFFGSEHGVAEDFTLAAKKVVDNEARFDEAIQLALVDKKTSYARAYTEAFKSCSARTCWISRNLITFSVSTTPLLPRNKPVHFFKPFLVNMQDTMTRKQTMTKSQARPRFEN